ncbi:MAG: VWA domain-containing protein [Blastocatellia bacterium]|nr:VWA domain-containing protein [Blastocatellia bacterium]
MEHKFFKVAILLLAFVVGVAFAGISYINREIPRVEVEEIHEAGPETNEPTQGKTLEMVFVLDTTGSMGGLLDGAKQKIWSIVNEVMQKQSKPDVRVGFVAYRDRNDEYVTQIVPISSDLDAVYSKLMDLEAGGGGDTPESVRKALAEGVEKAGWSKSGAAKIIFLVGDAPPQNYSGEPDVLATTTVAVRRNIVVNTIQCGDDHETRSIWQQVARAGQGKYFAIAQNGGVEEINTPFDSRIAELGQKLGGTFIAYGAPTRRADLSMAAAETESKMANAASNTARADRALNKAVNKDAYNGDLIQDMERGRIKLDEVKAEDLPDDLQRVSPAERQRQVDARIAERKKIRQEILELSKQREAFLRAEGARSGRSGGFDSAVRAALADQLARRGIE